MVTVKVYAYTDEFGHDCEDFVIEDLLYPSFASYDEQHRERTARRASLGKFIPLPLPEHMNDNAVLIATYDFTEESLNENSK